MKLSGYVNLRIDSRLRIQTHGKKINDTLVKRMAKSSLFRFVTYYGQSEIY